MQLFAHFTHQRMCCFPVTWSSNLDFAEGAVLSCFRSHLDQMASVGLTDDTIVPGEVWACSVIPHLLYLSVWICFVIIFCVFLVGCLVRFSDCFGSRVDQMASVGLTNDIIVSGEIWTCSVIPHLLYLSISLCNCWPILSFLWVGCRIRCWTLQPRFRRPAIYKSAH